jgi:pimeloyl-ACP methyl ester carboxylesterase
MLHYLDHGDGLPVLWIHGFPLSGRIYEPQLEIEGVRHIVPDLPGFGRTPAVQETSMDGMARDVLSVLDHLGVERAVFAGLSMGGYVLLAAARLAPARIAGAILIDTRELGDSAEGRKGRFEMVEKVREHGIQPVVDAMLPKMLTAGGATRQPFVREVMESTTAEGAVAALRAMAARPNSTETLCRLSVPALIVVGDKDPITPPSDAERMSALIANSTLVVIPAAAHLSNVEQPQAFNRAVERFLREQMAGSLQSTR